MATLLSVNVGMPKDVAWRGRTVRTGIGKTPVTGPRMARRLNLDGDGQGDLAGHGGEQRAVLVYQVESLAYWSAQLGRDGWEFGQFGENFTVDGLPDDEVCVGDRYRIGEAVFEVTQPRVTCYRLGMRMDAPTLPALLVSHRRPGFYLRVITEGQVRAGDDIVLVGKGRHAMTVAEIDALLYLPGRDLDRVRLAADIPALSPGWQQSFREILAGGGAPPVGAEPGWTGFRPLVVTEIVPESASIRSIRLAAPDGTALPPAEAGRYLTLRVPGDPAPVRSYSLSSAPGEPAYRISVKRDGRVSSWLHRELRAGMTLDVAAPRGDFVLADGAEPVLLISAGVGVTPLLAMLHRLAAQHTGRAVWWLHTARDRAQLAFAAEVTALLAGLPHAHQHVFLTAEGRRLTADTITSLGLPVQASAYLCGPRRFMDDLGTALAALNPRAVHTERFGERSAINPGVTGAVTGPPHQPPGPPGTGPRVTFARAGLSTRWPASETSLLTLAEACDVPTRWACRSGVCHTCVTPVLAGEVGYDPRPLELPGPGDALLCCARPDGDVVLDL
ncbi:MOSC and FAD-binding oxidoreductase domain-containing protein [Actinoplanes sp. L3-i22]|uniref:MOSC and FAD-binding oxidoreductase domain-containing protein n=1 Tax=Actinoplanes sp. L3-i22 TaxID=2836373 RepID=UPI001C77B4FB|nr:MOSC and FAD-binding oxidoreductase domain-containing protein [Actinoplanes sp. L3-i22]BCY10854.1 sulfurase [Actinoplanes sp. L3-i22]